MELFNDVLSKDCKNFKCNYTHESKHFSSGYSIFSSVLERKNPKYFIFLNNIFAFGFNLIRAKGEDKDNNFSASYFHNFINIFLRFFFHF